MKKSLFILIAILTFNSFADDFGYVESISNLTCGNLVERGYISEAYDDEGDLGDDILLGDVQEMVNQRICTLRSYSSYVLRSIARTQLQEDAQPYSQGWSLNPKVVKPVSIEELVLMIESYDEI